MAFKKNRKYQERYAGHIKVTYSTGTFHLYEEESLDSGLNFRWNLPFRNSYLPIYIHDPNNTTGKDIDLCS